MFIVFSSSPFFLISPSLASRGAAVSVAFFFRQMFGEFEHFAGFGFVQNFVTVAAGAFD